MKVRRRDIRLATWLLLSVGSACSQQSSSSTAPSTPSNGNGGTGGSSSPAATTGVNDSKLVILATGLNFPFNLLVDATNVYWNDAANGSIAYAPVSRKTTAATTYLVPPGAVEGIDIAQDASTIYFSMNDGSLRKVAKTGGATAMLTNANTLMPGCGGGLCNLFPSGLVAVGGRLIFGNGTSGNGIGSGNIPGPVLSISTTGTGLTNLSGALAETLCCELVAADNAKIYFSYGGSVTGNSIQSIPLAGGAATIVINNVGDMSMIAVPTSGAGAGALFYTEVAVGQDYETLRRFAGGSLKVLATINTAHTSSMAFDDSYVYYPMLDTNSQQSVIAKQSLTTGTVTILAGVAATNGVAGGVAVDAANVYWVSLGDGSNFKGSVRYVPKS